MSSRSPVVIDYHELTHSLPPTLITAEKNLEREQTQVAASKRALKVRSLSERRRYVRMGKSPEVSDEVGLSSYTPGT